MIDLKTIRSLVKMMVDNELTELDVADGEEKVRLKRGPEGPAISYAPPPVAPSPVPAAGGREAAAPDAAGDPGVTDATEAAVTIDSPMVGTFYHAPSPDAAPFVQPGDRIEADTVVCLIEAMKVFNEIKADRAGVIETILVESGQAVEFGQPLFTIKPG
jgi:acetyl-CoA carboxylase biotin carboxyl carrier protein